MNGVFWHVESFQDLLVALVHGTQNSHTELEPGAAGLG